MRVGGGGVEIFVYLTLTQITDILLFRRLLGLTADRFTLKCVEENGVFRARFYANNFEFISHLPPDSRSGTPPVSSDEEAAWGVQVHAQCLFNTSCY
jgi:hypothetical protein